MNLSQIASANKNYYETNYEKLKNYMMNFSDEKLFNYNKDEIFDVGEIVSSMIYMKANEEYSEYLLEDNFDFTPAKYAYDAMDKKGFLEIKCRRKSLDHKILYSEPALFKLSKWNFCMNHLDTHKFKYTNIFHDRIFIYNINEMRSNIYFNVKMENFKSIKTDNVKGNQNIKFIPLHFQFATEIQFSNSLRKELADMFDLLERIEIQKQKKNKVVYGK